MEKNGNVSVFAAVICIRGTRAVDRSACRHFIYDLPPLNDCLLRINSGRLTVIKTQINSDCTASRLRIGSVNLSAGVQRVNAVSSRKRFAAGKFLRCAIEFMIKEDHSRMAAEYCCAARRGLATCFAVIAMI